MDFWEMRQEVAKLIPRMGQFIPTESPLSLIKEKGRKVNYHQYDIISGEMKKKERLLNLEEMTNFIEVSLRSQGCPMSLNVDCWDGLTCEHACAYCLPPSSQVFMYNGKKKAIGRIRKGERVVSFNTETGVIEISEVTGIMRRKAKELLLITSGGKSLRLTPEHPVYTKRGWIEARGLTTEDRVFIFNEEEIKDWLSPFFFGLKWTKIDSISYEKNTHRLGEVCNIECVPNNNYVAEGMLVHNCFADNFRASLYTSFFDNGKSMSFRYCNPDYFKEELDKLMVHRGTNYGGDNGVIKAISLGMPIRLGIRFEDFLPVEKEKGISLAFLKYLRSIEYPVMINTKSDLVGEDSYLEELSGNKAKSAVHITMISSDEELMKKIESGAPSFKRRIQAAKNLVDAGIKVVARIEPFMLFINDNPDMVKEYVEALKWAGVKSITLDSYSYSAYNMGIKNKFMSLGYDFDRMFTLMSDCQWLGSLVLGKFMEYLRSEGFSCSTFDFGNVPDNNDPVCCEVGKWFGTDHFCYGNIVSAIRFISSRDEEYTTWGDYENHVTNNGGFLTSQLQNEVKGLWNCIGNSAYFVDWGNGIIPYGMDKDGVVWAVEKRDFREDLFNQIIGG